MSCNFPRNYFGCDMWKPLFGSIDNQSDERQTTKVQMANNIWE